MAARIPSEFIDELLTRVDIVDVVGARVALKRAGKEYKACCPFHDEKTPSFTVSPDKQFYHCFGCGAHGTVLGFLMEYDHMEFREAVEDLAAHAGLKLPEPERHGGASGSGGVDRTGDLLALLDRADHWFRRQLREHPDAGRVKEYLKGRGLTGEVALAFGLGFAPDAWDSMTANLGTDDAARENLLRTGLVVRHESGRVYDRFRDRVMFPIHDHRGRVVGFGGRILGDGEPKYLNSPETPVFHKGSELYGLHRARGAIKAADRAVVVEGYMDVVALAQFGIDNAVATLGTATTRQHLDRLFRYASEVVFCFDGDRAGRDAAWRALETALPGLRDGRQIGFLFLPEGEDPDSIVRRDGADALRERLDGATPLPDYLFERLASQVDLDRLDGRARLVELARPLIGRLPAGALRELMFDRLAELSRASRETLPSLVPQTDERGAAPRRRRPLQAGSHSSGVRRSLMSQAIGLLIQHPRVARLAQDWEVLRGLDLKGMDVFLDLMHQIRANPDISTAALLERYRDTDHHKALEKLAVWEHLLEEREVERQFADLVERLHEMHRQLPGDALLSRSSPSELTPEEKQRARELYSSRAK